MTKAAFIRQHPSASPAQLSKLAKKAGLTITPSYVANVRAYDKPRVKGKGKRITEKVKRIVEKVDSPEGLRIKMSDLNLDPAFNQRSMAPSTDDTLKVSGDGLVRAFKALVVAIGTRVARQLVTQVEDETSKLFGRPPV